MAKYILAHDIGTSGNKASLYTTDGVLYDSVTIGYNTSFPGPNRVEQDPDDFWSAVCTSTQQLIANRKINPSDILCVSFSAQMMGCIVVDKSGKPLRPMIIWADTRADAEANTMIDSIGLERGYRITGHRISASYSAAKLLWIKNNEPDIYAATYKMLNAKDYIISKFTGVYCTDYSDASGTNLLDLTKKVWSDELLECFGINKDILPELKASYEVVGSITSEAAHVSGLLQGTPVVVGGGDGSCAAVGSGIVEQGQAYNVVGTSSWVSYASTEPLFDDDMSCFNWVSLDEKLYMPCGTMQAAGLSYQWLRNTLFEKEFIEAKQQNKNIYEILNQYASQSKPGADGLLFLPYLVGERSPLWDFDARGCFIGISPSTSKNEIIRSVLEGVAFNLRHIIEIMEAQEPLDNIVMIGGGARGNLWLEIFSNVYNKTLVVPKYIEEATSLGAAICGGIGVGVFKDFSQCKNFNPIVKTINPNENTRKDYDALYKIFKNAYLQLKSIFKDQAKFRGGFYE